jgi:AcrR family transcriptional regulator
MADPDAPDARTRLREVALDLFGRQGVRDTSTRQILTAAGMRNPSAITYHFGSKAELVDDLVAELIRGEAPVMQLQVALGSLPEPPSALEWVTVAVDSSSRLISTERGCLLARLWWEYDGYLHPGVLEEFLSSGHSLANQWVDALAATFPELPRYVALTRNVTVFRTLEWMIARRAGRLLTGKPSPALQMTDPAAFHQLMLEVSIGIMTTPTSLTEADIIFGE